MSCASLVMSASLTATRTEHAFKVIAAKVLYVQALQSLALLAARVLNAQKIRIASRVDAHLGSVSMTPMTRKQAPKLP